MEYKIVFIKNFFIKNTNLGFDILHQQNLLMKKTSKSQHKIIKDYNKPRFKKFVFFNSISKKNTFIIGDLIKKKRLFKTLNIIYCSDISFLKKNLFIFYTLIQKYFKVHFCGEFYIDKSKSILRIPLQDVFKQYIAYHEGWGNYKNYKKNKKVISLAKKVERQSNIYKNQLSNCIKTLNKKKFIIF